MSNLTTLDWARVCRIEAVRSSDAATKALLVELAEEFENLAGQNADVDPDDFDLQNAAADRLVSLAAKRWFGVPG